MKNMLWRRVTGLKKGFTNLRFNRRMRITATAEPSARPLNSRPGRVALMALGFFMCCNRSGRDRCPGPADDGISADSSLGFFPVVGAFSEMAVRTPGLRATRYRLARSRGGSPEGEGAGHRDDGREPHGDYRLWRGRLGVAGHYRRRHGGGRGLPRDATHRLRCRDRLTNTAVYSGAGTSAMRS